MISRGKRDKDPAAQPLSNRAIVLGATVVLGIGAAAWTVLWWRYGSAGPRVELDAVRTASAITVAAGGAAALLLAARRQRSTELTLEHQREVAQATERDAAEQRITELYTRAVDQLGAEKAPVRLGGLHALERLAQNNPAQRQTIIDVLCSYLRMPYTPPPDRPHIHYGIYRSPGPRRRRHRTLLTDRPAASPIQTLRYQPDQEERQVRLTAQRILSAHLKPKEAAAFWEDIDLDLTKAHLYQFDLSFCHIRKAQFGGATFAGQTTFVEAEFAGDAWFVGATFTGDTRFNGATFAGEATFHGVTFTELVGFVGATFAGTAGFLRVRFTRDASFSEATFAGYGAMFGRAMFAGLAHFDGAEFTGYTTSFEGATFAGWHTAFDRARVAPSSRRVSLPTGWTTRAALPAEGEEEGWRYVVREEDSSEQSADAPGEGSADPAVLGLRSPGD